MVVNKGVAPVDPTTEVGQFRLTIGDATATDLEPPEAGFGNYEMFSDDEIEAFLNQGGSMNGAIALAYLQMAGVAARESKSVQDMDLRVDLTKRATDLRLLAQFWQGKADAESAEIFELFDGAPNCRCRPELAQYSVCEVHCRGNFLF